jgi:4-amino-4-deoxy-L-arabinose transferase-like glycosyltransferase
MMSSESIAYRAPSRARAGGGVRRRAGEVAARLARAPELIALLGLTALLDLWNLGINGWANTYYSAAVRSMAASWHNFLFASLDQSGLMTVDKPPLALWVQALSARIFGFHPLALLIPEALMGVAAVALLYDLVRRRFGRIAGFVGGLTLATTPITIAVARHNNPDELLILCSVAALWFAVRALESGRARHLVLSAVCVGLGFETKMGVALLVVPGIAAAWLYVAPRGRRRALRDLLAAGVALVVVAGAWPLLVEMTSPSQRPWISGTADNRILSLILGYNGVGRIAGQAGGPQALGGGTLFGGPTGPFRLLQSGLGDQAGWLLGFAVVALLGIALSTRLSRRDPRAGWLIVIGGAFLTTAVVFSFASGIFHPYYVSLLAPFSAALVGAGAALLLHRERGARIFAAIALVAAVITELVVLGGIGGRLAWATPLVIAGAGAGALALLVAREPRSRAIVGALVLAVLLAAPATWAFETLGHAANATFPEGGSGGNAAFGPRGAPGGALGARPRGPGVGAQLFGPGAAAANGGAPAGALPVPPGGGARGGAGAGGAPSGSGPGAGGGGGPGGFGQDSSALRLAVSYAESHGGGTVGVASQSSAASAIISTHADVAGLGGFSGRESSISVSWLAGEVRGGHLRWVLAEGSGEAGAPASGGRGGAPRDARAGSRAALGAVERSCRKVPLSGATLYDCAGRAAALEAAAR